MRTTTVLRSELDMNDWRAEHYVPAPAELVAAARAAGFSSGASGHNLDPRNRYWTHGRKEVRNAFKQGYDAGTQARVAFLGDYDDFVDPGSSRRGE